MRAIVRSSLQTYGAKKIQYIMRSRNVLKKKKRSAMLNLALDTAETEYPRTIRAME